MWEGLGKTFVPDILFFYLQEIFFLIGESLKKRCLPSVVFFLQDGVYQLIVLHP